MKMILIAELNLVSQDRNFINRILFLTNLSTSCLNGHVNRHWFTGPEKLNVWCGIIGYHVTGPTFINENLNSEGYLRMLRKLIVSRLRELLPSYQNSELLAETIWFQQDGAPSHFGRQVRQYLNKTFPGRWIGRMDTTEWPARSPGLTPLAFFL
mgnify:CR=1 FL=1